MTLADIISDVQKALKEPTSNGHWTSDQYLDIASDVQRRVITEIPDMLETKWTQALSTGNQEITLPVKFTNILGVTFDDKALYQTTFGDLDLQSTYGALAEDWRNDWSGEPLYYYLRGGNMGIAPKVGADYTGLTLAIYGYKYPADFTATTDIPFDGYTRYYQYHSIIAEGMLWKMKLSDENEFYKEHKEEFYTMLRRIKDFMLLNPGALPSFPLMRGTYTSKPTKEYPLG